MLMRIRGKLINASLYAMTATAAAAFALVEQRNERSRKYIIIELDAIIMVSS